MVMSSMNLTLGLTTVQLSVVPQDEDATAPVEAPKVSAPPLDEASKAGCRTAGREGLPAAFP